MDAAPTPATPATPAETPAAPTTPVVAAASSPVQPSILGRVGLILAVLALAAPVVGYIYVIVNGGWPGERLSSDISGLAGLSAFFFAFAVSAFAAPVAIVGVVLGIVSLTRKGRSKTAGILAIVLGALPSLAIFNWLIIAAMYNSGG